MKSLWENREDRRLIAWLRFGRELEDSMTGHVASGFRLLLIATAIVRGIGAGVILDVAVVGIDTRHEIGDIAYAQFARALFARRGKLVFVPIAIGGALLTLLSTWMSFTLPLSPAPRWCLSCSLASTAIAFLGTSKALPAITAVRRADGDNDQIGMGLDLFARWHSFSAVWQLLAFSAHICAMVLI